MFCVKRFLCIMAVMLPVALSLQCHRVGPQGRVREGRLVSSSAGKTSVSRMYREVNLRADMVPRGRHGRKVVRPMRPRYITIHSTQNYRADANQHSIALKRGALRSPKTKTGNRIGYLIWHFTVDDREAIQHMPISEQGEHADFHGPGNRLSIGIEMCEHRGSSRRATIERTAKLTAILMKKQGIPLRHVVPHYHWPRKGRNPPNKNCPHFLLDNGKPGKKWRWFLGRVNYYYQRI
jgi:N-acetylmuramoyl-L-alanine amidase